MVRRKDETYPEGKSEKLRALKDADLKRIPVHYRAQKSSWMTCQLFTDFLKWFNTEVGKKEQNRQVLLFMDNAGVHNISVDNVPLKHTKVVFYLATGPSFRSNPHLLDFKVTRA